MAIHCHTLYVNSGVSAAKYVRFLAPPHRSTNGSRCEVDRGCTEANLEHASVRQCSQLGLRNYYVPSGCDSSWPFKSQNTLTGRSLFATLWLAANEQSLNSSGAILSEIRWRYEGGEQKRDVSDGHLVAMSDAMKWWPSAATADGVGASRLKVYSMHLSTCGTGFPCCSTLSSTMRSKQIWSPWHGYSGKRN